MRTHFLQLLTYAALSTSALVVPLYASDLGASYEFIGLIGAATGLAGVASNIAFGRLGDRTDRTTLLAFGFAASAFAYFFQAVSTSPVLYLLSRVLVGFTVGIIPATLVAYVYEKKRPLGTFTSYNAVGWLVGSALIVLAGVLPSYVFRFDWMESSRQALLGFGVYPVLFVASGAFSVVAWMHARRLPSMRVRLEIPLFPVRIMAANAHVYGSLFLRHLGATAIWTIYPLYIVSLGGDLALVGWVHILNMVAQIFVLRTVERSQRLGHPRVLIATGLFLSAVVFVAFAWVRDANQLLPLQLIVGVSFATLWLGCLKEVLDHNVERATATGLLNASMSLSNVVGPLLGGIIAHQYGFRPVLYFGAAITAFSFVLFLVRRPQREVRPIAPGESIPRPIGDVAP